MEFIIWQLFRRLLKSFVQGAQNYLDINIIASI